MKKLRVIISGIILFSISLVAQVVPYKSKIIPLPGNRRAYTPKKYQEVT